MENLLCAKLYNDIKKIQTTIEQFNGQSDKDIEIIKENMDYLLLKMNTKEIFSDDEPINQVLNDYWLHEY